MFKIGDSVVYVGRNSLLDNLTIDKTYYIIGIAGIYSLVIKDDNEKTFYINFTNKQLFRLLSEYREEKISLIFNENKC